MSEPRTAPSAWLQELAPKAMMAIFTVSLLALTVATVRYMPPIVAFAIPAAFGAALVILRWPEWSFIGIVAGRIFVDLLHFVRLGPLNLMQAYSGGVTFVAAILMLLTWRRIESHKLLPQVIPLVALIVLALIRSDLTTETIADVARLISPLMVLLLTTTVLRDALWRTRLLTVMVIATGMTMTVSWYYLLFTSQVQDTYIGGHFRLLGGYAQVHGHAHAMAFTATLGLLFAAETRHWLARLAYLTFTTSAVYLLYKTYVRTPFVGIAAFGVVYLLMKRQYGVLITGFAIIASLFVFDEALRDRFADVFTVIDAGDATEEELDKVGSGRGFMWRAALNGYLEFTSFDMTFGGGIGANTRIGQQGTDTHNDYLSLLAQLGPIGLLSYLAMQWRTSLLAFRNLNVRQSGPETPLDKGLPHYVIAITTMVTVTNALSNSYVNRVNLAWLYAISLGLFIGRLMQAEQAPRSNSQ